MASLLAKLKSSYQKIERTGVKHHHVSRWPDVEPRAIQLSNLFAFIGCAISFLQSGIEFLQGVYFFAISDLIGGLLLCLTFAFNALGLFRWSRFYIVFMLCADIYYFNLITDFKMGLQLLYFLFVLMPFFLFTSREIVLLVMTSFMTFAFYCLNQFFQNANPIPTEFRMPAPAWYAYAVPVVTFGVTFIIIYRFLRISEMVEERVRRVRLESEIAIASTVQQTLLPASVIETPHFNIRSFYQAAEVCGGDWWGYFTVGSHSCFAIADATGHGLPSALITAAMRSCYSVIEKGFQDDPNLKYSPSQILSYANRAIYESAKGQILMTLFLGVLDLKTGELTYSCAGHNPPWLFKRNANSPGFTRKSLLAMGVRLGENYDVQPYEEKKIQIEKDDILLLYTDGLMDGSNSEGVQFSKKRTLQNLDRTLAFGPKAIIEGLALEVEQHNSGKSLDDDVTVAAIQIQKLG